MSTSAPHAIASDGARIRRPQLIASLRKRAGRQAAATVRWAAARKVPRRALNVVYNWIGSDYDAAIHSRFSKLFRQEPGNFSDGTWRVGIGAIQVVVPLRRESAWVDWDAALSLRGHEPELKQAYQTLVGLDNRPGLVLDVGANYGTHSIIFLVHGVRTILFEPNPRCHSHLQRFCAENGVTCELEPVAVGSRLGVVDLWYPEGEEWLGTTDASVKGRLSCELRKVQVPQTTIDAYVDLHKVRPDVLKIDTEGSDLQVLEGARNTLRTRAPLVLFESWRSATDRPKLWTLLESLGYCVCQIPLTRQSRPERLLSSEFEADIDMNFAAIPQKIRESWPPQFCA